MRKVLAITAITLTVLSTPQRGAGDSTGIEHFEKKIRPILVERCYRCHSSKAPRPKGGLLLDTRESILKGGESGRVIVPGDVQRSLLMRALRHEKLEMPPNKKLPDHVIADFAVWIKLGAPLPREQTIAKSGVGFWAFQPPNKRAPPNVKDGAWPRDDIDRFVLARLEAKGLHPNADADRMTLLRRVTFDLIGLPPTPEEIEDFLNDHSRDAYAKVVDRLLASPQFGQRWGRHWLDVARFAESAGQSRNISYRFAWRYRNWVIDAFNQDKPYDRFIVEQIAGDLLPAASQPQRDRQHVATGFLLVGPKLLNEGNASLVYRMGVVDDQIDTTFRAFLGLTVGCARCHDHKYDPIPTRDYYALAGIFRSTANRCGVESNNNTIDNGLYPLGEGGAKVLAEIAAKKKRFAEITEEFVQARRTKQDLEAKLRDLQKKSASKEEQAELEAMVKDAVNRYADLARARNKAKRAIPEPPPSAMAAGEGQEIADCELFDRGDVGRPGKPVPRAALQVLAEVCPCEEIGPKQSGRLQLARWIANRRNPLTARVMVNRVWHHLFGTGLVKTVDNFGLLGERPSHRELLDHLAVQFMNDGWSIKRLIRRMTLSRTYQQSSDHSPEAFALDADNRLLWRMSRRRLEAEAIRDAMLAVAGRLDVRHRTGSLVSVTGMFEMSPEHQKRLRASHGSGSYRSVYLPVMRDGLPRMMKLFDAPDPSLVVGRRDVTTVAPQALFLLNDPFVIEQAQAAAGRIAMVEESTRGRFAYRLLLGGDPTSDEQKQVASHLRQWPKDWTGICHVLMATAEFRMLY